MRPSELVPGEMYPKGMHVNMIVEDLRFEARLRELERQKYAAMRKGTYVPMEQWRPRKKR